MKKTIFLFSAYLILSLLTPHMSIVNAKGLSYYSPWWKAQRKYKELKDNGKYQELLKLYQKKLKQAQKKDKLTRQVTYTFRIMEVYLRNIKDYPKAIEYGKKYLELVNQGEQTDPSNLSAEDFYPWSLGRRDEDWSKATWYKDRKEEIEYKLYMKLADDKRYEELQALTDWEMDRAKKQGDRTRQIILASRMEGIYRVNVKNFTKAIEYAELIYKLSKEGVELGPENLPHDWFYHYINGITRNRMIMNKKEEIEPAIKKHKIDWYNNEKKGAAYALSELYKYVGDNKKAQAYNSEFMGAMDSQEESWAKLKKIQQESRDDLKESLESAKKNRAKYSKLYGDGYDLDRGTEKQLQRQIDAQAKKIKQTDKKLLQLSSQCDIYDRIAQARAKDDPEVLQALLKEVEAEFFDNLSSAGLAKYGDDYVNSRVYVNMANQSYYAGLYQQAYDYAIQSIDTHQRSIPQYRQAYFKEHGMAWEEQIERLRKQKQQMVAQYGRSVAKGYDEIIANYKKQQAETTPQIEEAMNAVADFGFQSTWLVAGKSLRHLARYDEAASFLKKAYEYKPKPSRYVSRAESISREGLPLKIEALWELAHAYEEGENNKEAIKTFSKLIDYVESIRAQLTLSGQKIGYLGRYSEIYERLIRILISEQRQDESLTLVERSRSRAFVDLLGDKRLKPKSKKAQKLIARRDSIESEYVKLLSEPATKTGSAERSIQVVQKQMEAVIEEIKQEDAEFISATTVETLKADQIQELLDSNTAIVEYYLMPDAVSIWVVTNKSIKVEKVNVPIWIVAQKVAQLREQITDSKAVKSPHQPPQIRLEIVPKKFKNGDEHARRVHVKNNSSLFLSIEKVKSKIGASEYEEDTVLEKEIPAGEEKMVLDAKVKWTITPGIHQVVLQTDQGKLVSNQVEVSIDGARMVTVTDKGGGRGANIQADIEKYASLSLYDLLIKPVKPYLNKQRVIIIPHGVLHYLPFAALENNGRYLIEDYALTYLPSATVYKFCKDKAKKLDGKLLAFGNPDLGDPGLDIPFALTEAKAIGKLYSASKVLSKDAASEAAFKTLSPAYDILHLASHGVFNADNPMESALLLSSGGKEDGRLTMSEIFDLDINAGLVTLSACSTGMSRIRSGDEMMGLPRAFIYAGVPSIAATLWNINDEATAILMTLFYKNLKTQSKSQALRMAQLDLLKKINYKKPYYWAAFYLIGDYQ